MRIERNRPGTRKMHTRFCKNRMRMRKLPTGVTEDNQSAWYCNCSLMHYSNITLKRVCHARQSASSSISNAVFRRIVWQCETGWKNCRHENCHNNLKEILFRITTWCQSSAMICCILCALDFQSRHDQNSTARGLERGQRQWSNSCLFTICFYNRVKLTKRNILY